MSRWAVLCGLAVPGDRSAERLRAPRRGHSHLLQYGAIVENVERLYELLHPGQDGRHVDLIWPLWILFDLIPEGRGIEWYPRLAYT